jgi:hypothetical protein
MATAMTGKEENEIVKLCEGIDALCRKHSTALSFTALVDVLSEVVFDQLEGKGGDMMQRALLLVVPCFVCAMKATCATHGQPASNGSINWKNIFSEFLS